MLQGGFESTPLYVLFNGEGAVMFFFALSGFVLTRSMFMNPSWIVLAAAVIKRLPRLMVPAGVSIFAGLLILKYFSGLHLAAAAISHSGWLQSFGDVGFPKHFRPSLGDALRQSLFVFLRRHDAYYNSNLWTMVFEFWGSMLVFFITAVYCIPRLRTPVVMVSLHILILLLCCAETMHLVAFVGGSLLAYVNINLWPDIKLPRALVLALLLAAVAGFSVSARPYETGAAIIILFLLIYDPAAKTLMAGRTAAFLGQISFPIYLVSTLIILSVSSGLFVLLSEHGIAGVQRGVIVLLVTLSLSLLTCLPLVIIDRVWLRWLNKIVALAIVAFVRVAPAGVPVLSKNDSLVE